MERDDVKVRLNNQTFIVDRGELATNMQRWNRVAGNIDKRVGEPVGHFPPNEYRSSDYLGVAVTVVYGKRKILHK